MQIYLAPMEGVTGYIVRNAFAHNFGQIDKYFTPFIPSAKRLSPKLKRDLDPANNEGITLVPQLISNRCDEILDMIRQLKDYGYKEFNLNLGCPSGTVVSGNRGSGLLRDPEELDRLLGEIYEKVDVPFSLKTRIGFDDLAQWDALLDVYMKYPANELIIHPRLRKEMYNGFPHLDAFAKAYDQRTSLTSEIIYNGDIWNMSCYRNIMDRFPGLCTVMIGRGLLARPYLSSLIKYENTASRTNSSLLTDSLIKEKIRSFCDEIYNEYASIFSGEKDAVIHMKEIWINLKQSFSDSEKPVKKILKTSSPAEYKIIVKQIFELPLADPLV